MTDIDAIEALLRSMEEGIEANQVRLSFFITRAEQTFLKRAISKNLITNFMEILFLD